MPRTSPGFRPEFFPELLCQLESKFDCVDGQDVHWHCRDCWQYVFESCSLVWASRANSGFKRFLLLRSRMTLQVEEAERH